MKNLNKLNLKVEPGTNLKSDVKIKYKKFLWNGNLRNLIIDKDH